jgi:hypothetical protein
MRKTIFAALVLATSVIGSGAATEAATIFELRPFVGAFIPTGAQQDILNDAVFFGGQGGVEVGKSLHVIGTVGYVPRENSNGVALYQYDAGVETFRPFRMTERWELRPFLGIGMGGRTYVDGANGDHAETILTGYGALGTEFQIDRLAFRVEARDYLSRFKGLDGSAGSESRNDVSIVSGVAIHW